MTIRSHATPKIRQYIIDCIDLTGLDGTKYLKPQPSEKKPPLHYKLNAVYNEFESAALYAHNLKNLGSIQNCLISWIKGLPSIFNVDFDYSIILNIMESWGYNKPVKDESISIDLFYSLVSSEFIKMRDKANKEHNKSLITKKV